jgi:hypothetical protein
MYCKIKKEDSSLREDLKSSKFLSLLNKHWLPILWDYLKREDVKNS